MVLIDSAVVGLYAWDVDSGGAFALNTVNILGAFVLC